MKRCNSRRNEIVLQTSYPMRVMDDLLKNDLDPILELSEPLWRELNGARVFFTGGTGLFGLWFLEAMDLAQKKFNVSFDVLVLSRSSEAFLRIYPQYKKFTFLKFHQGNVTDFDFPKGQFSHVIHAATTSAKETFEKEDELKKFNTVAEGTRRVLEFAASSAVANFLLTSSGSVYGKQPKELKLLPEEYAGAPLTTEVFSGLGQGKRVAEYLCTLSARNQKMKVKMARCFSFIGPYLPLNLHYAVGNFIQDGIIGRPILVKGDGLAVRSYLYLSDMVLWLLTILIRGESGRVYNVGSEEAYSIRQVAEMVSKVSGSRVEMAFQPQETPKTSASDLYVPSTQRARNELGLRQSVNLEESVRRTFHFYKRC